MWHLAPGKAAPNGKADCHGWVEVATRDGCREDEAENDAEAVRNADLEHAAVGGCTHRVVTVGNQAAYSGPATEDEKEDTNSLSGALTKNSRALTFESQTPTRDWLGWQVARTVLAQDVGDTAFDIHGRGEAAQHGSEGRWRAAAAGQPL